MTKTIKATETAGFLKFKAAVNHFIASVDKKPEFPFAIKVLHQWYDRRWDVIETDINRFTQDKEVFQFVEEYCADNGSQLESFEELVVPEASADSQYDPNDDYSTKDEDFLYAPIDYAESVRTQAELFYCAKTGQKFPLTSVEKIS